MRGIDFTSPRAILACVILLLLAETIPAAAEIPEYLQQVENPDLAAIPRTILKEPKYQNKTPGYCLLVFGLEKKTRVWLVVDGEQVYIDRNGNGDLTEAGEYAYIKNSGWFRLGNVTEADGKTTHESLRIRVWEDGKFKLALRSQGAFRFVGHDALAMPRLAVKPADAPIIHPNGPITLAAHLPFSFIVRSPDAKRGSQLSLVAGSRGLGPNTFTIMDGNGVPGLTKGRRKVLAEIEFPARSADGPPVISRQSLRVAGWNSGRMFIAGPVSVPKEAGGGIAKLKVRLEGIKPGDTGPATTFTALVLGDKADLPAVRAAAKKAVPMLVLELQRNRPNRDNAAVALGQFGPAAKDAVPALTLALDDQNICGEAAKALIKILPAGEAVPLLVPRLQNLNGSVHSAAAEALGLLGPKAKSATGALIECLKRKQCEYYACQVLARIGTASDAVIPALIEALRSDSESVCGSAAGALGKIGPEAKSAIPGLIQILNEKRSDYVRLIVAEALGQIGPAAKDAIPVLTRLANTQARRGELPEAKLLRENAAKALKLIER